MILGLDLGSVSLKYVLLSEAGALPTDFYYLPTRGEPVSALNEILVRLRGVNITAVGYTGSGRRLLAALLGAGSEIDEITAHRTLIARRYPEIKTVFEIGGQDSKLIYWRPDDQIDFGMNTVCAAGTGAFLEQQASRLGLSLVDFCLLGQTAKNPFPINAKCAVFAESDMISATQSGISRADIIAGLHRGLISAYWQNLVVGKKVRGPFMFEGGAAENPLLLSELERRLRLAGLLPTESEVLVPKPWHKVIGAWGAAIKAGAGGAALPEKITISASTVRACRACRRQCGAPVTLLTVNGREVILNRPCGL